MPVNGDAAFRSVARSAEENPELREAAVKLRELISAAAARRPSDCLLLSGGLDTAVLAPLASAGGTRAAVTVIVKPDAPDAPFAQAIARDLGWRHHLVEVSLEDLVAEIDLVVRTLRTFDPMEIRNSVVIARGLAEAARHGYRRVMTGDAADELFGGYSFMWGQEPAEFEEYSRRMAETMRFSSFPLGRALGVEVLAPYTDPEVIGFAKTLPKRLKVSQHDGITVGKWVLRWAFPECPSRWRRTDPIEVGSGSTRLPAWFQEHVPLAELSVERTRILHVDRIEIRDAEHLVYYRAFRRQFGRSLEERGFGTDACAHCGFDLPRPDATFCPTCGAYPARP